MRMRSIRLGIMALVLSWGWSAEAQLRQGSPIHKTLEIQGPAIGASLSGIAPFSSEAPAGDVGFHVELPLTHTISFRSDVGLADWTLSERTVMGRRVAEDVSLARGTFTIVERPHSKPGRYFGAGFGVYRFALGETTPKVRRVRGMAVLGGIEAPIKGKVVVGLELHGHLIRTPSDLPPALSLIIGAAVRMQWRY